MNQFDQAQQSGACDARRGYRYNPGSLGPKPGESLIAEGYRTGYLAELARITNRRMTGEQRDLLIAHDRAVAAWKRAAGNFGSPPPVADPDFVREDLRLFGLNPWITLGIRLGEYQGPAAQAGRSQGLARS